MLYTTKHDLECLLDIECWNIANIFDFNVKKITRQLTKNKNDNKDANLEFYCELTIEFNDGKIVVKTIRFSVEDYCGNVGIYAEEQEWDCSYIAQFTRTIFHRQLGLI